MSADGARSSLLCLVFTDLVDSTALKSRLGDAAAGQLMARYHADVLGLASKGGGREIDSAGDGFFLTFEAPSAAVAFALELQLLHEASSDLPAVRVGIHLGEVTERTAPEGSSKPTLVEGLAVDLAARIGSLAAGSQVLMSLPVFDTARQRLEQGELPREISWLAHGPYLLKGIDEPVEIGEAGFPGLSPLAAPEDSEKARRAVAAGDELTLGWRPAVGMEIPGRPHWQLVDQLGSGAIGEVWLAEHEGTRRRRVFKFCFQADSLRSLKREVALLRILKESLGDRPDIAQVLDWEFDRPPYFLETEHSESGDLVDWARSRGGLDKVPLDTRLDIVAQIADALTAAHSADVLHKDLKPANVLIHEDAAGHPHVCLTDFGIGLVTSRSALEVPGVTVAGLTEALLSSTAETGAGTRLYMAPEVMEGREATSRSDLYSLGVVLYQMASGDFTRALAPGWERHVDDALVREDIAACVDGDPDNRLAGPRQLAERLRSLSARRTRVQGTARRRKLVRGAIGALVFVLLAVGGLRAYRLYSDVQWAEKTAVPEIIRLVGGNEYPAAFALASEVERRLGVDPRLDLLWEAVSTRVDLTTEPAGASVSYRHYEDLEGDWTPLGTTPVEQARAPLGVLRWRIEKPGYESRELAFRAPNLSKGMPMEPTLHYVLDPAGETPEGMIAVDAGTYFAVPLAGFTAVPEKGIEIGRFYIDRTEVTNEAFEEFVAAGGYRRPELWTVPFVKDGRTLSFEQAMEILVDGTGRGGPAGWLLGHPPEDEEHHPVGGVSWYEAAAYAEFRGKSLPTLYHWVAAALPGNEIIEPLIPALITQSNLATHAAAPVGSHPGLSIAGAVDMAGNVAEWAWNAKGEQRYLLGASWSDPAYFFSNASSASPWRRRATNGFRLAMIPAEVQRDELLAANDSPVVDFRSVVPHSDDAFELMSQLSSYETTPLNARVEATREPATGGHLERVSFDAAYGDERVVAYVMPPEGVEPPYQAVIWFAGANVLFMRDSEKFIDQSLRLLNFVPKSGRMIVMPIYADTLGRNTDGLTQRRFLSFSSRREIVFQWQKDLGRTLDYLEERGDVQTDRVGYVGLSLGAMMAATLAAREPRIATLILWSGGFPAFAGRAAAVDSVSAATRTRIPVLMLNGRYDFVIPIETSQRPFFEMLATPDEDKRHVVYEAGHFAFPLGEAIRENVAWLDRYLGPTGADAASIPAAMRDSPPRDGAAP
jgi:serine/threonine protein kinase/class 3 adenylate cyclase/formylglycine-generating enzyme required for sulfatase activity/dienelactone hydrolase